MPAEGEPGDPGAGRVAPAGPGPSGQHRCRVPARAV